MSTPRTACRFGLLLCVLCFWAASFETAFTQSASAQSIKVGPVTLTLGMSEDDVLSAFGREKRFYSLRTLGSEPKPGTFFNLHVWSMENAKPKDILATLTFNRGVLGVVAKNWTVGSAGSASAADVSLALYSAFQAIPDSDRAGCVTRTTEENRPDLQARTALIRCGLRTVKVTTAYDPQRRLQDASVTEDVELPGFFPAR